MTSSRPPVSAASFWMGLVAWLGVLIANGVAPRETEWAVTLLLLSPLVLAPLVLRHRDALDEHKSGFSARFINLGQPIAALLLVWACAIPQSPLSMMLCLPWLAVSVTIASAAVKRLRRSGWVARPDVRKGVAGCSLPRTSSVFVDVAPHSPHPSRGSGRATRPWSTTCTDFGSLYLLIGAVWLCLWRLGLRPLGFEDVIVMLTAIHFHYAGFILPHLAGWSGERRPSWLADATCLGVILGVPAVACGITATQLGFPPIIEAITACGLSLAGAATAVLQLTLAAQTSGSRVGRVLLVMSSLALIATMALAALYGLRPFHQWAWLDIPWMRAWHGTGNTLGACLCGVLGHKLLDGRSR